MRKAFSDYCCCLNSAGESYNSKSFVMKKLKASLWQMDQKNRMSRAP